MTMLTLNEENVMKKLLMLSALILVFAVPVAIAKGHGGGHGERMFEKKDVNGDGVISKDEFMTSAEEMFGKLDADGNGEVTKEEAHNAKEKMKEKWKDHKQKREDKQGSDTDSAE